MLPRPAEGPSPDGDRAAPRSGMAAFARSRDGGVALLFALAAIPLLGAVGAALDYSRASSARSVMALAADAAALAAANETKRQIEAGAPDGPAQDAGRAVGLDAYKGIVRPGISAADPQIAVSRAGMTISATVTAKGTSPNVFAAFLPTQTTQLGITSTAATSLTPFVDIALLVDVSGSMSIGADAAAIARLQSALGCAFACHDGTPVKGTNMDAYQWAVSQGIPLRTQAVNTGISEFLDWLGAQPRTTTFNRVGIYSFADTLIQTASYSSNMTMTKGNLPQTTNAASELTAATHFKEIMPLFTQTIGAAGDGSTRAQAKKLVIIATDGVQDPNRTWTTNTALRAQVGAFDPAQCTALKNAGVSVGVIHTAYVSLAPDWGYLATLGQPSQIGGPGTRADDVGPQLAKCASPGLYQVASSAMIAQAFQSIFSTFALTRYTQ